MAISEKEPSKVLYKPVTKPVTVPATVPSGPRVAIVPSGPGTGKIDPKTFRATASIVQKALETPNGYYLLPNESTDQVETYLFAIDPTASKMRNQGRIFCVVSRYHHYMKSNPDKIKDENQRVQSGLDQCLFEGARGAATGSLLFEKVEWNWNRLDGGA